MGWSLGVDGNGRDIGYGVEATCDAEGCAAEIDRGLGYRCGDLGCEVSDEPGCGGYFCSDHLFYVVAHVGQFCGTCSEAHEPLTGEPVSHRG